MKIEIYSIPNCPYCVKAKALADAKGHEVEYKMMGEDFDIAYVREHFPEARTFPQILVDGKKIGGYVNLQELLDG